MEVAGARRIHTMHIGNRGALTTLQDMFSNKASNAILKEKVFVNPLITEEAKRNAKKKE